MQLTPEQVKGRIKSLAKVKNADARVLMRIYMMERFLERVENLEYKDNFIFKSRTARLELSRPGAVCRGLLFY